MLTALDIVVFPSLWEGTPLTAFEALAAGKPIVATDADGLLDILTDRQDALVVPKRDAGALARAVDELIETPGARRARWRSEAQRTGAQYDIAMFVQKDGAAVRDPARDVARDRPRRRPAGGSRVPDGEGMTSHRRPCRLGDLALAPRPRRRRADAWARCSLAWALTVDFPSVTGGFFGDASTYYSLAHSLAEDFDFEYRREDLVRVWREFPSGPEGIFLKRGRDVQGVQLHGVRSRSFRLTVPPTGTPSRLYYAKSFIYPLFAAPFVWLFGTNGFLVLARAADDAVLRVRLRVSGRAQRADSGAAVCRACFCSCRSRRSTWCG